VAELALEDVFGERATRHLPRRTLERHGTRRRAESDIVQRLGRTGIGQAHVGGAGGLVGAHLLLDRAVARIVSMFVSHWSRVRNDRSVSAAPGVPAPPLPVYAQMSWLSWSPCCVSSRLRTAHARQFMWMSPLGF